MHADAAIRNPASGNGLPTDGQLTYSVPHAAKVLDLGVRKVWELVADGRLESIKIDSSRRIPRAALDAFIQGRREDETHPPAGPSTPPPAPGPKANGCAA